MRSLDYVRSMRNAALAALAFVALPASGAAAQQRVPWVVVETHGDVAQQTADGALPVAPGATLVEGAPVRTGADGTLVLAHGNDRVAVSANSAFAVPAGVDPATGPSLLQMLGTLLFKIEHTPGRRFEVDTPYLAAVVKGTVFTVSINGSAQMVHVAEGAVEVTAAASHEAVLVRPGQTATLSSPDAAPSVIDGSSPGSDSERDAPREDKRSEATPAPVTAAAGARKALRLSQTLGGQPLDVAALTNGLVKAGKDSATATVAAPSSAGIDPALTVRLGAGGSSSSAGAGAPTEASSAAAAPPAPGTSATVGASPAAVTVGAVTPVAGVTAPVTSPLTVLTNVVPPVVDAAVGVVHGAAQTAKLPGANNPLLTGRKLP